MKRRGCWSRSVMACLALALIPGPSPASPAEPRKVDVVVYGATAGGVVSAISLSREGKTVVIVEPGRHVGGMVTGGLGATDFGNRGAIGGISREFYRSSLAHYVETYGSSSPQAKDCSDGFKIEPHVAGAIFRKMLDEAKVEVVFESTLVKLDKQGARIVSISTDRGGDFVATAYIDASYEGDLMARAGVKYAIGREGRDQYGESIAGVQAFSKAHQWPLRVEAFGIDGKLLPTVQPGEIGPAGAGDGKTQAYTYRLCMTDRKENQVPFPRPPGYDPTRFELLARYLSLKPGLKVGQLMHPSRLPNGKTDTNNNGPFSTDHIGANWDYPDADEATRRKIRDDHIAYVQGFLYFLSNDPKVPQALRDEMTTWGLAKDEFVDNGNWPHQLYVREARRMIGSYVMTQSDIMDDRTKVDSVGLGSYTTDSHHVQRIAEDDGSTLNEGDFQVPVIPYAIPYRSLVPRPSECSNLLVPVCMSASHVAYGTVRMEPVYMILGQACGVAASMAVDEAVPVQAVSIERLTSKLIEQAAVLDPAKVPAPAVAPRPVGIDPAKIGGVVIDDPNATREGEWTHSTAVVPFVGNGYLHDGGKADGKASIRFTPNIPRTSKYMVKLGPSPGPNRATNTPVVIQSLDGEKKIRVDQRNPAKDGAPLYLGTFTFEVGERGWVEIHNDGTDGHVIADAVQFYPVP